MSPAPPATDRVAAWFATHTFHHGDFPLADVLARKTASARRVAVVIPTLDEAATIAPIVSTIRQAWMTPQAPLVDELLVIDSGSRDDTCALAAAAGATVHSAAAIRPDIPCPIGKGTNLWKAGFVTDSDILCFIDGDIRGFLPHFVPGLVAPLLMNPGLSFCKAFYERPLTHGTPAEDPGGGRVTEILVRPLFSTFFPELSGIIQPLSGEYAMCRPLHRSLAFPSGYGVEACQLVDIVRRHGLDVIAQVDLDHRRHRVRTTRELGRMACHILHSLMPRLHVVAPGLKLPETSACYRSIARDGSAPDPLVEAIDDIDLPPLDSIPE